MLFMLFVKRAQRTTWGDLQALTKTGTSAAHPFGSLLALPLPPPARVSVCISLNGLIGKMVVYN